MAVRFYDEALSNKVKSWVKDPHLKILKPDESTRLFEVSLDTKKDAPLELPLIALSRDKSIEITSVEKQSKTFNGFTVGVSSSISNLPPKQSYTLNVIPIKLSYQLDIYTRFIDECDEYLRNFIFNFINYPKLEILLPYNDLKIKHDSVISLDPVITDNSDIKEHLFADQFTRFTIKLNIDDAYLFSLPLINNALLEEVNFKVKDSTLIDPTTGERLADEEYIINLN